MGSRDHSADRARVLADAAAHGVERAGQLHGVSVRTIKRWRATERERERTRQPIAAGAQALVDAKPETGPVGDWLEVIDDTIAKLGATTKRLCEEAGPDDLRTVTEALVKLTSIRAEHEILRDNGEPDGPDRTRAPDAADAPVPPKR